MAGLVAAQRRLAITDSLTGLYTRRFFQEEMRVESARASRGDTGLGLLLLDVDEFKRINDTFGHPAGDRVLQELAGRLQASCRPGDIIARYGGEEFAVLLSGAAPAVVTEIAERIRRGVASQPLRIEDGLISVPVTVSVGAATLPRDGVTEDAVVRAADRALYEAKRTGRNRVVTAWQSPRTITTHSRPR
jgi:diguanylate cyclase (GGDEF)-like protein